MEQWWHKPFRIFQTNLREVDATLDVEKTLDDIQAMHADTWLLNTGGIVSFYPSRLEYQHPSPWLAERASGDLIRDAVEAAHARGVRVISRLDFSKQHRHVYDAHPDWFFLRADGRPQVYNGLYSACPSGPYNQFCSFEILAEILDNYPIDGLFFNMFGFAQRDYSGNDHGVCQCFYCRRAFRESSGMALPLREDRTDPAWGAYQKFKEATARDLAARMKDFIHQRRPDVPLVLFAHAGVGDVILHEINNAIDRPLPYWAHHTGERIKQSQGAHPQVPVAINSVLFLDIPYRFAAEQPHYIGLRLAQILAHGANPYLYVLGTTRQWDRRNHAIARQICQFHQREAADYADLRPCATTALIRPDRSSTCYPGADRHAATQDAFRGWYRALVQSHEPFDVIAESDLPELAKQQRLQSYQLMILPHLPCLGDQEGRWLDEFVDAGRRLIAGFETGCYDEQGRARPAPLLGCLGMEQALRTVSDMRGAYLVPDEAERARLGCFDDSQLMALLGPYVHVGMPEDADPVMRMIPPHRFGPPEKCYWDHVTDWPGLIERQWGQGVSVHVPWQPDRHFHHLCLPEYGQLLAGLVRRHRGQGPRIWTDAGPRVEVVLRRQGDSDRLVVHLVNFAGQDGRAFYEPPPLRHVSLAVRVGDLAFSRARSAMQDEALEVRRIADEQGVRYGVTVPRLGLFDKITFEP